MALRMPVAPELALRSPDEGWLVRSTWVAVNVNSTPEINEMSTVATKGGTTIYYKDWGSGPVVTFSHGWPLCSDAWDRQMLFLAQNGFRVVAHDRRGHGRSSQAWSGNDMN